MTLFQFVLTCTWLVFVLFAIDLYQRQKFNLLHFIVFFWGTATIVVFWVRPDLLSTFWQVFGVARGADVIVYGSIIFLVYLYFEIIHTTTKQKIETTRLCTSYAIHEYEKSMIWTLWQKDKKSTGTGKDDFAFLIRAYNEATTLWWVIDEIIGAWFWKIIICNDGSSDATEQIINQKISEYPQATIIWLHHLINRWPWAANKTLFAFWCTYAEQLWVEWRVTYDADGQMSIHDMAWFVWAVKEKKYDMVIGSRFVEGAVIENMPLMRKLILYGSRVVTRIFNGVWVTDVPTGYRMYHVRTLPKIHITSDRFSYQNEIISALRRHNLSYIEIPVHIKYTEYSLSKWQSNMSAFKILKELIYKALFFK